MTDFISVVLMLIRFSFGITVEPSPFYDVLPSSETTSDDFIVVAYLTIDAIEKQL